MDLLRAKSAPSIASSKNSSSSDDKKHKQQLSLEMPIISTSIDVKLKNYKECVFKYLKFFLSPLFFRLITELIYLYKK